MLNNFRLELVMRDEKIACIKQVSKAVKRIPGLLGGWVDVKAVLRIVHSKKKNLWILFLCGKLEHYRAVHINLSNIQAIFKQRESYTGFVQTS